MCGAPRVCGDGNWLCQGGWSFSMMTELRSDEQGWEGRVWAEQRGRESGPDKAEEAGGVLAT